MTRTRPGKAQAGFLALVLAALTTGSALGACDPERADLYEQKAREAGQDLDLRATYYGRASNACPRRAGTRAAWAGTLLRLDEAERARDVIESAVQASPRHSEVRRVYGDVLRALSRPGAAREQYQSALVHAKIPRDRFYALAGLGWAHHDLGDHVESTRAWVQALDMGIVFDPVTNRAIGNMIAWNYAVCRAAAVCDGATAVRFYEGIPAAGRTWYELGTGAAAYARAGDFSTAVRLQQESIARLERADLPDQGNRLRGARSRMLLYRQGLAYTEN